MRLFGNKRNRQAKYEDSPEIHTAYRDEKELFPLPSCMEKYEYELYDRLRAAVPIIDAAIKHANRKTMGHFFDVVTGKRYDEEDMIVLREKDFIRAWKRKKVEVSFQK